MLDEIWFRSRKCDKKFFVEIIVIDPINLRFNGVNKLYFGAFS